MTEGEDPLDLLRRRVLVLADTALTKLEHDLNRGSINQRNAALRLISPYLLKTLDATGEEDQFAKLRDSLNELMSEVRGSSTPESTEDEPVPAAEPPEDSGP